MRPPCPEQKRASRIEAAAARLQGGARGSASRRTVRRARLHAEREEAERARQARIAALVASGDERRRGRAALRIQLCALRRAAVRKARALEAEEEEMRAHEEAARRAAREAKLAEREERRARERAHEMATLRRLPVRKRGRRWPRSWASRTMRLDAAAGVLVVSDESASGAPKPWVIQLRCVEAVSVLDADECIFAISACDGSAARGRAKAETVEFKASCSLALTAWLEELRAHVPERIGALIDGVGGGLAERRALLPGGSFSRPKEAAASDVDDDGGAITRADLRDAVMAVRENDEEGPSAVARREAAAAMVIQARLPSLADFARRSRGGSGGRCSEMAEAGRGSWGAARRGSALGVGGTTSQNFWHDDD